jgi:hypothetical protein
MCTALLPKIRYTIEYIECNKLQNPWRVNSSLYLTYLWCREELRLKTRNVLYPPHLYKGIVWTRQGELLEEKTTSCLPNDKNIRVGWGYIDIKFNASRLAGNQCVLSEVGQHTDSHDQPFMAGPLTSVWSLLGSLYENFPLLTTVKVQLHKFT